MFHNPLARLTMSTVLFLILIILLEDWIVIEMRSFVNRERKNNKK